MTLFDQSTACWSARQGASRSQPPMIVAIRGQEGRHPVCRQVGAAGPGRRDQSIRWQ